MLEGHGRPAARNGSSRAGPPDCPRAARRTPAGERHADGTGRERGSTDEFRKVEAGSGGARQPIPNRIVTAGASCYR